MNDSGSPSRTELAEEVARFLHNAVRKGRSVVVLVEFSANEKAANAKKADIRTAR